MPQLSLCMIVRNGGAALRAALESARPYVDDLVVVDTGSSDESVDVAHACGARVEFFSWIDSFSAARNRSLDVALGDWIFWMDADDELPRETGEALRQLLRDKPTANQAFSLRVEETIRDARHGVRTIAHEHVKLFPRHPAVRFQYRIHEQIAPSIRALGWPIHSTSLVVRHAHADRSPAGERARSERNLRLALLDLADRPDDPFVWASVGTSALFHPGEMARAVEFLARAAAGFPRGSSNQLNAVLYWGQALAMSGADATEETVYREALAAFPHDQMLQRRLADVCERQGRWAEAARWLRGVLEQSRLRTATVHVRTDDAALTMRLEKLESFARRAT